MRDGAVVVTGASGFVGRHLTAALGGLDPQILSIRAAEEVAARLERTLGGRAPDCVLHLGGRAHQSDAGDPAALEVYRADNVRLSAELARAAAARGMRRFVFVSSITVFAPPGERQALTAASPTGPGTAYGLSKLEAEQTLADLSERYGFELVVVRPPLVVGPGAGGNLRKLAQAVRRRLPLPFGRVRNRRSMIHVRDLAEMLVRCIEHPAAPGEILLPAAPEPIGTPDLIRAMAEGLGVPAYLLPVPVPALRGLGTLAGRRRMLEQLCGSLEVDPSQTIQCLDWQPQRGVAAGIREFAADLTAEPAGAR